MDWESHKIQERNDERGLYKSVMGLRYEPGLTRLAVGDVVVPDLLLRMMPFGLPTAMRDALAVAPRSSRDRQSCLMNRSKRGSHQLKGVNHM